MVFERFTPMARRVIMVAQEVARQRRQQQLHTDDMLAALAEPNGTSSSQALAALGVAPADVTSRARRKGWRPSPDHMPLGVDTKRAIEAALREADNHGEVQIGSAHLLLGLVAERHGEGGRISSELGLSYDKVRSALSSVAQPESDTPHSELMDGIYDAADSERQPGSSEVPEKMNDEPAE